ncbi:MAG: HAMP domain-containing histidine kinase [Saprospiraceae bacterium]|nr:HAMP domain-containing histidine kinase [Saprospiraceae bacterium]
MTAEMVLNNDGVLSPVEPSRPLTESHLPFSENIAIYDAKSRRVFTFNAQAEVPSTALFRQIRGSSELRFLLEDRHALGLFHRTRTGREYVIVAEATFNSEELAQLRNILMLTFFLGVGIVAFGGWAFAGQALAPVSRIVGQVDKIHPAQLQTRLETPGQRDEIGRLAATFNRLLDRIELAFRMQKNFISNVSHELKNPLSVITAQLEVALAKKRSAEEYQETLVSVLDDTRHLNEVSENLLQLAKVHSDGAAIAFQPVRLDEALLHTRAAILRRHPDYHIVFDMEGSPEQEEQLCVLANEQLLNLAFLNLMDNGCKYSPDHRVRVRFLVKPEGGHQVEIADSGPGISPEDQQMIFQPFYRSAGIRHLKGSGIGLSLVDSILKLHQIGLEVFSGEGRGTIFRMNFKPEFSNIAAEH